ncbi:MAG: STAS domain-containing protein [Christensenellaceae bacterium]|jgi:stage II sporulation protein AA (anti-sigma F factor antagonist)|nr:STAS domain-containing protein [Christensenellaceae bacterium]
MQVSVKKQGGTLYAALVGELDHHSAAPVRQKLDAALGGDINELVLDMRGVSFMDSSGIGVILGRYKLLRDRGGKLRVSAMSSYAERIFRMAGMLPLLAGSGTAGMGARRAADNKGGKKHV